MPAAAASASRGPAPHDWSARARRRLAASPVAAVALVAFAVHARGLGFELVWDDRGLLDVVAQRYREGGVLGVLGSEFRLSADEPTGYYRPVVLLSLWLNSLVADAFPQVYHLTNVLLHVLTTALLYRLLLLLTGSTRAAFLSALVFAVHPVHVESVAFVSGRTDLLAALFVIGGAIAWAGGRPAAAGSTGWGILGAASFALALLSKEVAVMALPAFLVWSMVRPEERGRTIRDRLTSNARWLASWSAAAVLVGIGRLVLFGPGLGIAQAEIAAGEATRLTPSPSLVPAIVAKYLQLLAVPWPLNAVYGDDAVRLGLGSALGACLVVALCVHLGRARPDRLGLFALLWILLFLVPAARFLPFGASVIAERFLYLPSVGFALASGLLLTHTWEAKRGRSPALPATAVLIAAFSVATLARTGVWRDGLTLFTDVTKRSPSVPGAHYNLGNAYRGLHRYEEAASAYRRALALQPIYPESSVNLGIAYGELGRHEEAIGAYLQALRSRPRFPQALYNLGNSYRALGRLDAAIRAYQQAIALKEDYDEAHLNLGIAFTAVGRHEEAREAFQRSIDIRGDNPKAYNGAGVVHLNLGRLTLAAEHFERAIALEPDYATARYNLGLARLRQGRRREAAAEQAHLARVDPALAAKLQARIGAAGQPPSP